MDRTSTRNLLLQRLADDEYERVGPACEAVPFPFKHVLFEQGQSVSHVYFPERGVVSLITDLEQGESVETGTVGHEGFAGLSAVLGVRRSHSRALCQIPGHGIRIPEASIAAEQQRGSPWFALLLRYADYNTAMIAQSAACNRAHHVDLRMSRWLLMTHDRVDGDEFPLTQDFLATMLGVSRPTVNIAGATLQQAGFIKYSRGRITVVDRAGLESAACECYGRIQREYDEVIGPVT